MAECRICFEDASFNELIAPCLCNGTSRYVHRRCLERWRQSSSGAFSRCYECNFSYSQHISARALMCLLLTLGINRKVDHTNPTTIREEILLLPEKQLWHH